MGEFRGEDMVGMYSRLEYWSGLDSEHSQRVGYLPKGSVAYVYLNTSKSKSGNLDLYEL